MVYSESTRFLQLKGRLHLLVIVRYHLLNSVGYHLRILTIVIGDVAIVVSIQLTNFRYLR